MSEAHSLGVLFVLVALWSHTNGYQCIDEDGEAVDWYVAYKMPRLHHKDPKFQSDGKEYIFMTSTTVKEGWRMSSKRVSDEGTLFENTLKPYYKDTDKGLWALYNDQGPEEKEGGGHTKGVVGASSEGGFWLVHSVPHFAPPAGDGYSFPSTGLKNGQSFLCLSLTKKSMEIVGKVLMYNNPDIYDFRCERNLAADYPDLVAASNGSRVDDPPYYLTNNLTTLNQTMFTVFAKSNKFGKDLYQFVADQLRTNLLCETWLNEKGALPSNCSEKYKVYNIQSIFVTDNYKFSSGKDHSKWAVGEKDSWICIGDINRATPQEKRGGGTVCVNHLLLSEQYRNLIQETEPCNQMNLQHPQSIIV